MDCMWTDTDYWPWGLCVREPRGMGLSRRENTILFVEVSYSPDVRAVLYDVEVELIPETSVNVPPDREGGPANQRVAAASLGPGNSARGWKYSL